MESTVSTLDLIAMLAIAALQGSLVALPRAGALPRLSRLRSPAWAAALPGSILFGTFGPLWRPSVASGLLALAALATPLLAVIAAAMVARGRRALLVPSALVLVLAAMLGHGPLAALSASIVTGFGCLSVGVALTRLIAPRWLLVGVVATCLVDVVLLTAGLGQHASALMADATAHMPLRAFDTARVGAITIDYPDLVLAGVLGGLVAGRPSQRVGAMTVTLLAAVFGLLLATAESLPATVPIAATFVLLAAWDRAAAKARRRLSALSRNRRRQVMRPRRRPALAPEVP
jgi:hypothetical protein